MPFSATENGFRCGSADYRHARRYVAPLGRFASVDPGRATARAPQSFNRFAYVWGNPLRLVDPTGTDVSIRITFTGDTWNQEVKALVLKAVQEFWDRMKIGKVFVFDSGEMKQTNPFWRQGVAGVTATGEVANSRPHEANVGALLQSPLTDAAKANAIANVINHEVFTHQLALSSLRELAIQDYPAFDRSGRWESPEYRARYGTIVDSNAPALCRDAMTRGPLPVFGDDLERAREILSPVHLEPPASDGAWWRPW